MTVPSDKRPALVTAKSFVIFFIFDCHIKCWPPRDFFQLDAHVANVTSCVERFSSIRRTWLRNLRRACWMISTEFFASPVEVFDHRCFWQLAKVGWSDRVSNLEVRKYVLGGNGYTFQENKIMQTTMARLCVAYGTSSPTTSSPVFNVADRVEEATRKPTDDVATWDKECYGWFEHSGIVAFTSLRPKGWLN